MVYTTHTQNGGAQGRPPYSHAEAGQPPGFGPQPPNHQGFPQPNFGAAPFSQPGFQNGSVGYPALMDPALLRAARQIYRQYYEAHPDVTQRPVGVAVNRYNYRGKLIFGQKPVLLPQEYFIPFEQIQAELY